MRQLLRAAAVHVALNFLCWVTIATAAYAQSSSPGTSGFPAAGSSLLNPNISAIGWFQAEAGDQNNEVGSTVFELREVELGYQATVDPYSRADFFISVNPEEGIDLEEGTLTLLTLPAGLSAKLGKFRSNFGKFNRTHPPETPFADRPLAAERFFGEEGLTGIGGSASWLAPLQFYLNFDAEVSNTPEGGTSPAFASYRGKDLLYLARASSFLDLGESMNLTAGTSVASGANGSAQPDSTSPPEAMRALLYGADLTFRWKNPRRAIYRALLAQIEWLERSTEELGGPRVKRHGAFAYVDFQFVRRWHAGARYDWSDTVDEPSSGSASGVLGFVTFNPSEFASMSAQVRSQDLQGGASETRYFFKTTFNIGPHGQHPF